MYTITYLSNLIVFGTISIWKGNKPTPRGSIVKPYRFVILCYCSLAVDWHTNFVYKNISSMIISIASIPFLSSLLKPSEESRRIFRKKM